MKGTEFTYKMDKMVEKPKYQYSILNLTENVRHKLNKNSVYSIHDIPLNSLRML